MNLVSILLLLPLNVVIFIFSFRIIYDNSQEAAIIEKRTSSCASSAKRILHVWASSKSDCIHFLEISLSILARCMRLATYLLLIVCYAILFVCMFLAVLIPLYYLLSCAARETFAVALSENEHMHTSERNIDFYRWVLVNSIVAFAWKRYNAKKASQIAKIKKKKKKKTNKKIQNKTKNSKTCAYFNRNVHCSSVIKMLEFNTIFVNILI